MGQLFDSELKQTLKRVREIGLETDYEEMMLAHFLVALLDDPDLPPLVSSSVDAQTACTRLRAVLGKGPGVPTGGDVTMSAEAQPVLQMAIAFAHTDGCLAGRRHALRAVIQLAEGKLSELIDEFGLNAAC